VLILEKLSSAGESKVGRPENRHGGCFDTAPHMSNTGFECHCLSGAAVGN